MRTIFAFLVFFLAVYWALSLDDTKKEVQYYKEYYKTTEILLDSINNDYSLDNINDTIYTNYLLSKDKITHK